MHLINDSVISLVTSLFLPFGICLIPGIFRIPALKVGKPTRGFLYPFILNLIPSLLRFCALKAENQNKKCLYKFSIFIENYLG